MTRADLTKLLGRLEEDVETKKADAPEETSGELVVPASVPLYLSYQRKETRLRDDQQNGLTLLARRLTRAKGSGGERISDDTLIRIAVDLLLARSADLDGANEQALRHSIGLS